MVWYSPTSEFYWSRVFRIRMPRGRLSIWPSKSLVCRTKMVQLDVPPLIWTEEKLDVLLPWFRLNLSAPYFEMLKPLLEVFPYTRWYCLTFVPCCVNSSLSFFSIDELFKLYKYDLPCFPLWLFMYSASDIVDILASRVFCPFCFGGSVMILYVFALCCVIPSIKTSLIHCVEIVT